MGLKVGGGYRLNADRSFAFKRGRYGTTQIAGTPRLPRRKRKAEVRRLAAIVASCLGRWV